MDITEAKNIFQAKLSQEQFHKLTQFIYKNLGIKITDVKKVMLESRLHKRLKHLHITNFNDYIDYLFSKEGLEYEIIHLIDVVTTNKTEFFREPIHFDYLRDLVIPDLISKNGFKPLNCWSAGCSSGEEPYTLAIVLEEEVKKGTIPDYSIIATDISTQVLQKAIDAIYPMSKIDVIPFELKRKYFLKHKNPEVKTVRVVPQLRQKVRFFRYNLMDNNFPLTEKFDVIFCRNVIIYFDRQTQEAVLNRICTHLKPEGYLFLGHSESTTNMKVPVQMIKPTIFKKRKQ